MPSWVHPGASLPPGIAAHGAAAGTAAGTQVRQIAGEVKRMAIQHPVTAAVISQDRFEKLEVKKDDDTFVIISRWLKEGPEKAKVIILNVNEARELVKFFDQYFS